MIVEILKLFVYSLINTRIYLLLTSCLSIHVMTVHSQLSYCLHITTALLQFLYRFPNYSRTAFSTPKHNICNETLVKITHLKQNYTYY